MKEAISNKTSDSIAWARADNVWPEEHTSSITPSMYLNVSRNLLYNVPMKNLSTLNVKKM